MALRSRAFWLQVLAGADLWHDPVGSLHLAYQEDEAQVLAEFVEQAHGAGTDCELLTAAQVAQRAPHVKTAGLRPGCGARARFASTRGR